MKKKISILILAVAFSLMVMPAFAATGTKAQPYHGGYHHGHNGHCDNYKN